MAGRRGRASGGKQGGDKGKGQKRAPYRHSHTSMGREIITGARRRRNRRVEVEAGAPVGSGGGGRSGTYIRR